jgi:uncharacterized protein YukE
MSARESSGRLAHALKDLVNAWDRTRVHWRDAKAVQFEKEWLEQLPQEITSASEAIDELGSLLKKIRRDCE